MFDKEDEGAGIGLWVVIGVITLLLFGLIAGLAIRQAHGKAAPVAKVAVAASAADIVIIPPEAASAVPAEPPTAASAAAQAASVVAARMSAEVLAPAQDGLLDGPNAGALAGVLYFGVGGAELPADAQTELAKVLQTLTALPDTRVVLSGFHDASGDPAKNAELAKARAKAVRAALEAAGVDPIRIALRRPEATVGGGSPQDARRVEMRLVK